MKNLLPLVLLAGLVFVACPAPAAAPAPKPPLAVLDHDESAQLQKVHAQVLVAHPELKAEEDKLKAMHVAAKTQKPPPSPEQVSAAQAEWKQYQDKLRAEMLKIDPTLKPLFAKLDKEHARSVAAPAPAPAPAKTNGD